MSELLGWYYLHDNGDLIYKRELGETATDLRESDLVKHIWPFRKNDRGGAWAILVESLALGANPARVADLAAKWGCDDTDAAIYAELIGVTLEIDGTDWCAKPPGFVNMMESPAGFGSTALAALADLAKALGIQCRKTWPVTFANLVDARERGDG